MSSCHTEDTVTSQMHLTQSAASLFNSAQRATFTHLNVGNECEVKCQHCLDDAKNGPFYTERLAASPKHGRRTETQLAQIVNMSNTTAKRAHRH